MVPSQVSWIPKSPGLVNVSLYCRGQGSPILTNLESGLLLRAGSLIWNAQQTPRSSAVSCGCSQWFAALSFASSPHSLFLLSLCFSSSLSFSSSFSSFLLLFPLSFFLPLPLLSPLLLFVVVSFRQRADLSEKYVLNRRNWGVGLHNQLPLHAGL